VAVVTKDIERRLEKLEVGTGGIDPFSYIGELSDAALESRIEELRAIYDPETWSALVAEAKATARRS